MVRRPKQKNKALILIIAGLLMTTVVLMYLIVSRSPDRVAQIRSAEKNNSTSEGMTLALPEPANIYLKRAFRAEAKQNHLLAIAEYQNALREQPGQMQWHLQLVKNAAQEYQKRPSYRKQALQHLRNAYNLLDQSNAMAFRPSLDSLGQIILQAKE